MRAAVPHRQEGLGFRACMWSSFQEMEFSLVWEPHLENPWLRNLLVVSATYDPN